MKPTASQPVGARAATGRDLLAERRKACMLTMERIAYYDVGRAVEFDTHVYRAKTYFFETTLVNR